MKDPAVYMSHALECVERIERFTRGGEDLFLGDELIQGAVLHNLQVMAQVDEDLPRSLARALSSAGMEAIHAIDAGMRGRSDPDLLANVSRSAASSAFRGSARLL